MTEQEREDVGDLHADAPEAEDVGEELMAAALDAGLQAEDGEELDPEDQYDGEAVRVGRSTDDDDETAADAAEPEPEPDDDVAEPEDAGMRLSSLIGSLLYV